MSRRISAKTGSSSRGGHRTRRRILAAALRLFSRNGFHGTSIRVLARSAGLTEAAIYYHFPSKRAIVEALYERRGVTTALDELERPAGGGAPNPQPGAHAPPRPRVVVVEVLRGDRAAWAAHHELMERWRRGILDLLARYRTRHEIDPSIDVAEAADSWVNLMFGLFMDRLLALGRISRRSSFLSPEFRRSIEVSALACAQRLKGQLRKGGDGNNDI